MPAYCSPSRAKLMSEDSRKEFTGYSHSNSTVSKNSADTTTSQDQEGYIYLHFKCGKG